MQVIETLLRSKLTHVSLPTLKKILDFNLKTKAIVVNRDPDESGYRRVLNFGHTIGHLLEELSYEKHIQNENIPHGICVIYGMKFLFDSQIMKLQSSDEKLFYSLLSQILKLWNKQQRLSFKGSSQNFYRLCSLKLLNDKKSFIYEKDLITLATPEFGVLKKKDYFENSLTKIYLIDLIKILYKKVFT